MKVTDFEKEKILLIKDSDKKFLARIIDINLEYKEPSIDEESNQKGNKVIGKLTIFSKAIHDGSSCTREVLLEKGKNNVWFFWLRASSLLAGMPTHYKNTIILVLNDDLADPYKKQHF
jgi:hypothetical protein